MSWRVQQSSLDRGLDPVMRRRVPVHILAPWQSSGRGHAFLLLSPVTKPNPHYFFFEVQTVRQADYFRRCRLRALQKMALQSSLYAYLD